MTKFNYWEALAQDKVIFLDQEWRSFKAYPYYKFNSKGECFTQLGLNGRIKSTWNLLKIQEDKNGYLRVASNRFRKAVGTQLVHRIIALLFIPNPDKLPVVCHLDHNKKNNSIENLRWDTQTNNCKDSWEAGNRLESMKKCWEAQVKRVNWLNIKTNETFYGGARELVRAFPEQNLNFKCLSRVLLGNTQTHKKQWRLA